MDKNLVIVESPAKARTLSKFLGQGYSLKASLGHIRDLPRSRLGIDIENDFEPKYVVPKKKSKIVRELKKAVKTASTVYLATDPDREGEAIAWHLIEATKQSKTTFRRVVFHEITKEAIEHAFKYSRSIDKQLVSAQQARRVLDRLVGYQISPLLWRKVKRGLSAGRVQSVVLRIIVDREREILKFVPQEYWTIEAELSKKIVAAGPENFCAMLIGLTDGTKLALSNQEEAFEIKAELLSASYSVIKVKTKKVARQPAPPFITSTLQQEAWHRLRFSAAETMAVAQQLYEGLSIGNKGSTGLITYMRTDSPRVAHSATLEARDYIINSYGAEFVPPRARFFTVKVKAAQEAHEAIRPTKIQQQPNLIKQYLTVKQFKLYQLIWQRMVASQMAAASFSSTTIDIEARCPLSKTRYLFRASSSVNTFPGFMVIYTAGKDEEEKKNRLLPALEKGDKLKLLELVPGQHFTQSPPRFSEATLIKTLEQWGIGRPSTYAPILSTIQGRDYVTKVSGSLKPTELGSVVSDILIKYFPDIVDIEFTAHMEDELDKIANENTDWTGVVRDFYTPFAEELEKASQLMEKVKLAEELIDENCPKCSKPMVIKSGRFGKFIACSGYPECRYTTSFQVKTGVRCPECDSEIVEKINKKKRTFYGCSNYPNCQFATNSKPLPQLCPKCGGLLTMYREKWRKCIKCGYRGKLDSEEEQR